MSPPVPGVDMAARPEEGNVARAAVMDGEVFVVAQILPHADA